VNRLVLVFDDDPSLRAGLAALVGMQGHGVVTAETVEEGMAKLGTGPSHLLLDLNLPDGHGTAILRHVRANHLPVKVAVLSGTTDDGLLAEVADLHPEAVFRKPPDWAALTEWVAAA
jgi:DNA-binding response OmpR family regulator